MLNIVDLYIYTSELNEKEGIVSRTHHVKQLIEDKQMFP